VRVEVVVLGDWVIVDLAVRADPPSAPSSAASASADDAAAERAAEEEREQLQATLSVAQPSAAAAEPRVEEATAQAQVRVERDCFASIAEASEVEEQRVGGPQQCRGTRLQLLDGLESGAAPGRCFAPGAGALLPITTASYLTKN
jgi:hypothetical protein